MSYPTKKTRILIAMVILLGIGASFWYGRSRLAINHDITAALPKNDPVVMAAQGILKSHPALENIFIDITLTGDSGERDTLARAGNLVRTLLMESGLVKVVSGQDMLQYFSLMVHTIVENLPYFVSEADLRRRAQEMVQPGEMEKILREEIQKLYEIGAVGQAEFLAKDPLGLHKSVLTRMSSAMPFKGGILHLGHVFSKDGKHLFIMAQPLSSTGNTALSRQITEVLETAIDRIEQIPSPNGTTLKMIYMGSFRAALDNESIIRRDTFWAFSIVIIGLTVLIFISFRRPWIGILAIIPALAGIMLATFVYSLTRGSIFAISIGFGGALISIAVDHGLAYVLLLDKTTDTEAIEISREVWSVGWLTVLTTVLALFSLTLLSIPLFTEVGLFAALGVGLAAVFVHIFFPILFPRLKGSKMVKPILIERLIDGLNAVSSWATVILLMTFVVVMGFFIKFEFNVDLSSMNTVSPQTLKAEQTMTETWGDLSNQVYIMARGRNEKELWLEVERLRYFLDRERDASVLDKGLPLVTMFPGPKTQEANIRAWQAFWTPERISKISRNLHQIGGKLQFKDDAFDPFLKMIRNPESGPLAVPRELYAPFGVSRNQEEGDWCIVSAIRPGPIYQAESFFNRADRERFRVFDSDYFSQHLARELNKSFVKMLLIIFGMAIFILFLFFADWQIFLLSITPLAFSLIATLGTMGIIGLPLSIPSLMLAPILFGLGMDYGLYLVRSFQRYGSAFHPKAKAFRIAVLLGGLSTLLGMGSLALSEHAVLRSAGTSTFLGIFYALIGAFGILPPFLSHLFKPESKSVHGLIAGSKEHTQQTMKRFKHLEPYPRLFAWFKIHLDPMFPKLAEFVKSNQTILDVGCGQGVPAAWLLTLYPDLRYIACDPSPKRVRIAARVLGVDADVFQSDASNLPSMVDTADTILLLDILHYIPENDLDELLNRLKRMLKDRGKLILRVTIPKEKFSFQRCVETIKMRFKNLRPYFRTDEEIRRALTRGGFKVKLFESALPGREENWFIAVSIP